VGNGSGKRINLERPEREIGKAEGERSRSGKPKAKKRRGGGRAGKRHLKREVPALPLYGVQNPKENVYEEGKPAKEETI